MPELPPARCANFNEIAGNIEIYASLLSRQKPVTEPGFEVAEDRVARIQIEAGRLLQSIQDCQESSQKQLM